MKAETKASTMDGERTMLNVVREWGGWNDEDLIAALAQVTNKRLTPDRMKWVLELRFWGKRKIEFELDSKNGFW